jgi:ABC-type branched-subunit amino acid transport system permease subunit
VVTYQSSGVVNFAHAAVGTYVAFAFFRFRDSHQLILPVFGLPAADLGGRPTLATALVLCLALAVAINVALAVMVYRPLRSASPLARLVASLGVMLYFIEVMALRFGAQGSTALRIEPVLPRRLLRTGDITVYSDALWMAGAVVACAIAVWWTSRSTRFGLATRAVAEDERAAQLVGIDADVVAVGNWTIAGVLAAAGVIVAAPTVRLTPIDTSLLVVPAIAAALVGGFRRPVVAVTTALLIGMAQSEIFNLQVSHQWLTELGLAQGLPLLVILAVLLWRTEPPGARGGIGQVRLPSPRLPAGSMWIVAAAAAAGALAMAVGASNVRSAVIVSAIASITAMSVVVSTGYVGQISLATAAFAGVSAFSLVKLTAGWGVPFPIAPVLAAGASAMMGLLFAVPALRVRGLTLAMATLAAALAVEQLLFRWPWFSGGVEGARLPPARLFGIDFDANALGAARPRRTFGFMVLAVAVLVMVAMVNLARSATARRWLAVRANERAAAAAGISVTRAKLSAFAASAFLAGLGGALTAYSLATVSTRSFGVLASVVAVAIGYLTGIATPLGALVAGLIATGGVLSLLAGQEASRYQFATSGVLLVVAAIFLPDGIAGWLSRRGRRYRARP